jgi:hypothetical protein
MTVEEKVRNIQSIIEYQNVSIKLYFITREIKDGVKARDKIIDKYRFKCWNVDISKDLYSFFLRIAKNKLNSIVKSEDYDLEPYAVISDDLSDKLYTYALNNALSFSDVVNKQLVYDDIIESITSLTQIKKKLWAYTLKFVIPEKHVLIFRKLSQGKIVTDQPQTTGGKISSFFDSRTSKLEAVIKESINFDDKLDCLYFNEEFLIFRKIGFEQIVGLEDDFIESANQVIDIIKDTNLVEGIENIEKELKESRSLLKTLSYIGKKGNHQNLNNTKIASMKKVLKQFEGKELETTTNGKLIIKSKRDVRDFIKLLNDYYKQGVIFKKYYGTNSGQLLKNPN